MYRRALSVPGSGRFDYRSGSPACKMDAVGVPRLALGDEQSVCHVHTSSAMSTRRLPCPHVVCHVHTSSAMSTRRLPRRWRIRRPRLPVWQPLRSRPVKNFGTRPGCDAVW
jgi:hypothetical protein